ncbi:MAG: cache domain-containing protein [Campylobacterales bacterium]|nr:cache domain-containing protein [Campylobacterales bacterium]
MDYELSSVISHMPIVQQYRSEISSLTKKLAQTTLTGKVSSIDAARTLFNFMDETHGRFNKLEEEMVKNLVSENMKKVIQEASFKSQALIDMLVRNLFERTADVGFLATDLMIRKFCTGSEDISRDDIEYRLNEYVAKYSIYDDVIIFDKSGNVLAKQDRTKDLLKSTETALFDTIVSNERYLENYKKTDIQPFKRSALFYTAKIKNVNSSEVVGVLCLCFKFRLEMEQIYKELEYSIKESVLALVDSKGHVISSNNEKIAPYGSNVTLEFDKVSVKKMYNDTYIMKLSKTRGYQNYFGPNWYGLIMIPARYAFKKNQELEKITIPKTIVDASSRISDGLKKLKTNSEDINEDLSDVVLNGEIIASKERIYSLIPVLDNIRKINEYMNSTFIKSIDDVQKTVIATIVNDAKSLASLAVSLMDRNLYERANNCRWWSMAQTFVDTLSKENIEKVDMEKISRVLEYINSLYTAYADIMVINSKSEIVGCSKNKSFIGKNLNGKFVGQMLGNNNRQRYFVSDFEPTDFYSHKPTYIFSSTIMDNMQTKVIGGIALVFDAENEFKQILIDVLPKDENGNTYQGSFALFCDKEGRIVSSSTNEYKIDTLFDINKKYFGLKKGQSVSDIVSLNGSNYALGVVCSFGYREFKNEDKYSNDIFCLVFIKI